MKNIPGYNGDYKVTEDGEVVSYKRGEALLTPHQDKSGMVVALSKDGATKPVSLSRLVAKAFIPNPDGHKYVMFKDGDKTNCRADNLYWSRKNGDYTVGRRGIKLSSKQVEWARDMINRRVMTQGEAAEHLEVHQSTLSRAIRRK